MNYETQEEFEHFEGAMEQSVPQEDCCSDKGEDGTAHKRTETNEGDCTCRCHLPLVTTHLCPNCFNGCLNNSL